jgi:hypothetical protein
MRKVALFVGLVLGACAGLLTSLGDGIGLKIVMMSIGAVAGAAIGGALARAGRREPLRRDSIPGVRFSPEEHARNYWRDKGEIYPMPGHPDPEGARGEFDRAP